MKTKPQKSKGNAVLRIKSDSNDLIPDYRRIRASLISLNGISNVSINEVTSVVKVEYDPDLLTLDEIRGTIDAAQNSEKA